MMELKAKAKKVMQKEQAFDTKEAALKEAMKQCQDLTEVVSVWKAPSDMGGKYTIVQHENLERAYICGYTEVYDTADIYDKVKEQHDHIEEI